MREIVNHFSTNVKGTKKHQSNKAKKNTAYLEEMRRNLVKLYTYLEGEQGMTMEELNRGSVVSPSYYMFFVPI